MSIKVHVKDDDLDLALEQLRIKSYYLTTHHWYKKCHVYHEKPPSKKRKTTDMKLLIGHRQVLEDDPLAKRLDIHLEQHYLKINQKP
ncbi:hypothetical protein HX005_08645 [Acinetobacter sp. R933-2]|uniref:hypothetical protein n=1 Tax=Acinetobacter sp. R933-2 TaxID=2746728 RepID=UPI002575E282|nr:hypothetical protein [Acinetobacter sp. R933-2]MDM1247457.1 hypothetical protein [Acinetobacter sp. R933-2]